MTDASHITLLPRLLAHLREVAPGVGLAVTPIDAGDRAGLESGTADLALGYVVGLESGFHEQALYPQDFVCLAMRGIRASQARSRCATFTRRRMSRYCRPPATRC